MKKVRTSFLSKVVAVVTGIFFLNMSFFLTEIRMLNLHVTNYKLVENVIKLLSSTGFEEEKDSFGESSESAPGEQIVDLHMIVHPESVYSVTLLSGDLHTVDQSCLLNSTARETATPPPKQA
jgi:hypothetical protein